MTIFADDTKCHSALQHHDDNKILQSDLDKITVWCHDWKMSLNQCKCGVVHFSRSQQPKPSQYTLLGKPIKPTCGQKDLGIITTSDLKWKKQILEISSKANRMLGSVKQTALAIHDVSVRKALYMTMVRNQLAYYIVVKFGHHNPLTTSPQLNEYRDVLPNPSCLFHTTVTTRTYHTRKRGSWGLAVLRSWAIFSAVTR